MFTKRSESNYTTVMKGVAIKSLVHGQKTHLIEFRLEKGNSLPPHAHPHEQTGYLVSGRLSLVIEQETYAVGPGDSWSIPGGVEHGVEVLEDAVAVEVFSPVREEYLP
jgi:quercetin dioxygenase-like cupin family protein